MTGIIPNDILLPNRDDLQNFLWAVFGYLDSDSFAPLRSFPEKGSNGKKPPSNIWIKADEQIVGNAFSFVQDCNHAKTAAYVIPAVVKKVGHAKADEITQMQVLLVDIDDGNTETKLKTLEAGIGEATMVVESGGLTTSGHQKLHIYWQLTKPVSGTDLQTLLTLRHKLDTVNKGLIL